MFHVYSKYELLQEKSAYPVLPQPYVKACFIPQTYLEVWVFALVHTGGDKHWPPLNGLPIQLQGPQGHRLLFKLDVAVAPEVAAVAEDGADLDHIPAGLEERPERGGRLPQAIGQVADEDGDAVLAAVVQHPGHIPPSGGRPLLLLLRGRLCGRRGAAPREARVGFWAQLSFPSGRNAVLHPPALGRLLYNRSGEKQ